MANQSHDVVIAVMGMTGVGKSSFIKRVTGIKNIRIGLGLESGQRSHAMSKTFWADTLVL